MGRSDVKKVLVVTGTRADYGIYYPILQSIEEDADLDLHLLVTGMHLSPQFGYTIQHIRQDGFRISAQVDCLIQGSTHGNMAKSIGLAILGMTQALEMIEPDCMLILGDRGEMLAAAIAASHMNILLFHLHGGEVSGTIDESVRHAISKLSHVHLTATEASRERLIKMGEDPWRVHVVGAPRIETMMNTRLPELTQVKQKYDLHMSNDYILFIYHPVTTEAANLAILKEMVQILLDSGKDLLCVMPNADAGADAIKEVYNHFARHPHLFRVTNLQHLDYLTMLRNAAVLAGNSSSGIIEAASFHVPVINIGNRQGRRERSGNVIDISEDAAELAPALHNALSESFRKSVAEMDNVYGKANTSSSIVSRLKEISKTDEWIQKTISY
ncbi:UDP-N-acetylglucosamine 2-epimerase [Paenibacillus durus]|uniref:UDP-N-acetylglucosamine 2-epimerase n=1 Tax=Paenibacillus durus TaxID=44251 RepID=A0A089HVM1_PAEDU|nr:UDP-N-acetylglucosamine 2-epimerase [Paenibacillus durus]AIQ14805.1 UDP-N-acetylglucosamine 2-epimerase [Paenibacillus durus]